MALCISDDLAQPDHDDNGLGHVFEFLTALGSDGQPAGQAREHEA